MHRRLRVDGQPFIIDVFSGPFFPTCNPKPLSLVLLLPQIVILLLLLLHPQIPPKTLALTVLNLKPKVKNP